MAAKYPIPSMIRGNTFVARDIARLSQAGSPLAITRARMVLKSAAGAVVREWDSSGDSPQIQINGEGSNIVHLLKVLPADTALWPVGVLNYEVEVWFAESGNKLTILKDTLEIEKNL